MKLIDLIDYFQGGGTFEEFCHTHHLDNRSGDIEIYVRDEFNVDKDLAFFEGEKTDFATKFVHDNNTYLSVFDFHYFLEALEDADKSKSDKLSNQELAAVLMRYAKYDA